MHISKTIGFRIALAFGLLLIAIIINTVLSNSILDKSHQTQHELNITLNPSIRSLLDLHNWLHLTRDLAHGLDTAAVREQSLEFTEITSIVRDEIPGLNSRILELSQGWKRSDREIYEELIDFISDSLLLQVSAYTSGFNTSTPDSTAVKYSLTQLN